uniref:Uncharacterized protein n=1 Tax=Siphoviridae sp. cthae16 TaxID=2825617 RepID=A0A8S5URR7_9CAUD|nr:MAG TPA: hypothetical protein [Siphoviridae sp. cthae16]
MSNSSLQKEKAIRRRNHQRGYVVHPPRWACR